jgi:ATP-dependent helicase HepA
MATPLHPSPRQRWTSDAEPELGLGIVSATAHGRVTVTFPAAATERTYAWPGAPLRRYHLQQGDRAILRDGFIGEVASRSETQGVYTYHFDPNGCATEDLLADSLATAHGTDRLRRGDSDSPETFNLRAEALVRRARIRQSPVLGFSGARIDLLPHQIGIAVHAASRPQPRILLADEVGLGKTIEAGLITHRLHLTGRADRILVLVPEPLVHQWFVEMLRRFHLRFALLDEERCLATTRLHPDANPFLDDSLVIAALPWLASHPERASQCLSSPWDLLVVDEAHHLTHDPEDPAPEWRLAAALAAATPSVLLLTATPDQAGMESHFSRLQLLDPGRFASFPAFQTELAAHETTAAVATALADGLPPRADLLAALTNGSPRLQSLAERIDPAIPSSSRALLDAVLDSFGPGRIVFRNQRRHLSGFPGRTRHLVPLPHPSHHPDDHRLSWLASTLTATAPEKLLIITSTAAEAESILANIRSRTGIPGAAFHESLSLIQRDRAAAWFAEPDGARFLVCSEIGSEGRNFQCARHLVLFDLPLDPSLLEQRIGRLDRIGQRGTITIHVPFTEDSREAVLVRWYDEALDAFRSHSPAAVGTTAVFRQDLLHCLQNPGDTSTLAHLLKQATRHRKNLASSFHAGTARLLALQSLRSTEAIAAIDLIRTADEDTGTTRFFLSMMDHFGILREPAECHSWVLRPGDVASAALPELPPEGLTLTTSRSHALAREDIGFLTTDHPLWRAALDTILGSETGNACFALWRGQPAAIFCEAWFVMACPAPPNLQIDRFLPPTPIRILVDHQLTDLSRDRSLLGLPLEPHPSARDFASALVRSGRLSEFLSTVETLAAKRMHRLLQKARSSAAAFHAAELARLEDLASWPGHPAGGEAGTLRTIADSVNAAFAHAHLRLDAIRIMHRRPS